MQSSLSHPLLAERFRLLAQNLIKIQYRVDSHIDWRRNNIKIASDQVVGGVRQYILFACGYKSLNEISRIENGHNAETMNFVCKFLGLPLTLKGDLDVWASTNQDLWGNRYGKFMYSACGYKAFGTHNVRCSFDTMADHLNGVAERIDRQLSNALRNMNVQGTMTGRFPATIATIHQEKGDDSIQR